jgi:branched-chain amino acid transport system substrate-binding protein
MHRCAHLIACALLLLLSCPTSAQDEVPVGVILPLTGDGAFWGTNSKRGIELASEDLRALHNRTTVRFIFEDDRCDPKEAVAAFHKLVNVNKVRVILGPACSSSTLAIAPLAERQQVVVLAFSESDLIKTSSSVWRLWAPDKAQASRLDEYAFSDQGIRSVAIIASQNAFGTSFSEAFTRHFTSLGGTVVSRQEYSPSEKTFRQHLLRIRVAKPGALLLASYINDGAIIVREARSLGLKIPLLGTSSIAAPEFLEATKGIADGLLLANLPDSTSTDFKQRWERTFHNTPYPGISSGAPILYDLAKSLGLYLQKGSPGTIRDYLRTIDYLGASGRITFDEQHNLAREHHVYRIIQGTLEPVTNSSQPSVLPDT